MSDTEEVVLKRKPRNTKPEVAREKLKEKRERLKKEKENTIIEEAKKRLVAEEENRKMEEQKKKELAEADPMTLMMRRMEDMMARMNTPKPEPVMEEPVVKKRQVRKKKEPEVVYAEEPKPIPKQRKPRKKIVYEDAIDSPSNIFVGNARANIPQEDEEDSDKYYQQEQPAGNPLLNALAARRNMSSWY